MIRTIAILCFVAPAFGFFHGPMPPGFERPFPPGFERPMPPGFERPLPPGLERYFPPNHKKPLPPGLKIKHGLNIFGIESDNLIDLPVSSHSASMQGYIKMNRPRLPGGYCPLQLWCRKDDLYRVCIFTDETGNVAGVQFNIPVDEFTPKYDMGELGFTVWTTTLDNYSLIKFYAFFQFFVSPVSHKRIKSKDDTAILRDSELYYSGFGGMLNSVATDINKLCRIFTEQTCIEGLGHLYYYNMTEDLKCSSSTLSPFSAMFADGQVIGTKISVIGTWAKNSEYKDLYEELNRMTTMYSVPNGPPCLYEDLKEGGLSMTFFFTSAPWHISCGSYDD